MTPPPPRRTSWSRSILPAVALAWLATMAGLWRTEALRDRPSEDVEALIDQARLRKEHASARYLIHLGRLQVGELSSTVSGGQREEQLLYRLSGLIEQPARLSLDGFVLADWDRRPERFVLEVSVGGARHRIEGGLRRDVGGVLFEARYLPPEGGPEQVLDFVMAEAPLLAPGPLPIPELSVALPGEWRAGTLVDPITGGPVDWRIETHGHESYEVGGLARPALRHALHYGDWVATLWTEPSGFPLRVALPLGLTSSLHEESR